MNRVLLSILGSVAMAVPLLQGAALTDRQNRLIEGAAKRIVIEHPKGRNDAFAQVGNMNDLVYLSWFDRATSIPLAINESELEKTVLEDLWKHLEARVDKQTGSTPENSGSTSLAQKGAVPAILGFAVENGGLQRQIDGTTVTFRGTPVGLLKALEGKGYLQIIRDSWMNPWTGIGNNISFAVSFDASRGGTETLFTGNKQQVASWSVRYQIWNNRDPVRSSYFKLWRTLAENSSEYTAALTSFNDGLRNWPELRAWYSAMRERVKADVDDKSLTDAQAEVVLTKILEEALKCPAGSMICIPEAKDVPKDTASAITDFLRRLESLAARRSMIYDYAQKGTISSMDWTVKRDPKLPDLNNLTWILEFSTPRWGRRKEPQSDLKGLKLIRHNDATINASLAWFRNDRGLEPGMKQLRDFKLTGQYEVPLGKFEGLGDFVLTLAGRYERLPNDTQVTGLSGLSNIMPSTTTPMPATSAVTNVALRGNIHVFQAKLTIPGGAGIKIPLSFTLANRSELIKEKKEIGAHIGITFDLETLFAKRAAEKK